MNCVNCGHGSLVRSNFKLTTDGKPYCIENEKCRDAYDDLIYHCNQRSARQKGDKVQ